MRSSKIYNIILKGFGWNKVPAFTAVLAASASIIPQYIGKRLSNLLPQWNKSRKVSDSLLFASVFLTSWFSWLALNNKAPLSLGKATTQQTQAMATCHETVLPELQNAGKQGNIEPQDFFGRTLDLTLFAVARAADAACCLLWDCYLKSRQEKGKPMNSLLSLIPDVTTAGTFSLASAIIMWAWFYSPDRLPSSYRGWITSAAQVDMRLIEALRTLRYGQWSYGKPTSTPPHLDDLAEVLGLPREAGDHTRSIPFPCEIVHMRHGGSCCEKHFLWRFWTGFKFSFAMYFPLQIIMQLRRGKVPSIRTVRHMLKNAGRSSAFLGAFISIFYYSVCLVRTRIGPNIFSYESVKPEFWDGGACVGAGCFLCGWSILLESARKRVELALFVAPRGLAVMLPRRYENKYRWREQLAFSLSLATLLTAVKKDPTMVRGVLGKVLKGVLK
ncbi:hypothetical protein KEM54_005395 [Ascosphaera aggregata]|nr:hypothetical protein KEM54_005395 [Ascosphaera aggregata]